jgi:zinc/manganese transport system substrate-binding protein
MISSPLRFFSRACLAFLLCAAFVASAHAAPGLRVVASHGILADFARAVAGPEAEVSSLVPVGVDPHGFEPRPGDVAALVRAQVILVNGLGFDPWAERLAAAAEAKARVQVATAGIVPLVAGEACADPAPAHEHAHEHGEHDPHAWQDPRLAAVYVENIRRALTAADPSRAEAYAARAATYTAELLRLHEETLAAFAAVPEARRVLVTSHDALGYLAVAYGLRVVPIRGLSPEREPSARELAELMAQMKQEGARAIFVETTANPRLPELLARDAGIRLGAPLFTDSLGPVGGPGADYLGMFRHNVASIVAALSAE